MQQAERTHAERLTRNDSFQNVLTQEHLVNERANVNGIICEGAKIAQSFQMDRVACTSLWMASLQQRCLLLGTMVQHILSCTC